MSDNQRFESNEYGLNQENHQPTVYPTSQNDQGYYYAGPEKREQSGDVYRPYGVSPQEEKPSRGPRIVGIIAAFVAVAVLFAFGGGFFMHQYMQRNRGGEVPAPVRTREQLKVRSDKDNDTAMTEPLDGEDEDIEPTEPSDNAPAADNNILDKNFSLENAARRKDRPNLTISEIVENEKAGVVAIATDVELMTSFGRYVESAAGSGFIISEDGYVATNNHVVEGGTSINVILDDGEIFPAEIVGTDPLNDVAVLKMDADDYDFQPVVMGNSDDLKVGELAIAIGNPTGTLSGSVTAGIISALERNITVEGLEMTLLQTDAAINSGNSGGALFNSRGEVIGINTAKLSLGGNSIYEGLGFAIPINTAKPIIESLVHYGYVKDRTEIGIISKDITMGSMFDPDQKRAVLIHEVVKGSPAEKAGLKANDIIYEFDGREVQTVMDINNQKKDKKPGDKVVVKFYRNNKEMETVVTLEAQNP